MFPNVYGFHWTPGHLIFIGIFLSVVLLIFTAIAIVALRVSRDIRKNQVEAVRWLSMFHDLPARDRACRHDLPACSTAGIANEASTAVPAKPMPRWWPATPRNRPSTRHRSG